MNVIIPETRKEMFRKLENNEFEYMIEKLKMIFSKKDGKWEYEDEEMLDF